MSDGGGRPSARWRQLLHLGPSKADMLRRAQAAERETATQVAMRRETEKELKRLRREMSDRLTEPPPGAHGECVKIRLHTREEAIEFGKHVALELHEPENAYHPYECKACPRHPATLRKFWHIGHSRGASKAAQERRAIERGREFHQGNALMHRVTPAELARLRRV